MFISIYRKYLHYFERPCSHGMAKKTWRHERIILCICDQQVSFGQIMLTTPPPPNKIFPVRRWGYISCCCCFPLADLTHIIMYKLNSGKLRVNRPFLESPENVSGLYKSYFMLAVFAFKIKVSITLKMIQWKYKLTKQNSPVCELGLNSVLL